MNSILPNNWAKNLTNKALFSDSESCQNEYQMLKNLMIPVLTFLLSTRGSQKKINKDAAGVMKNCTTDDQFLRFEKIFSQNLAKLGNRNHHAPRWIWFENRSFSIQNHNGTPWSHWYQKVNRISFWFLCLMTQSIGPLKQFFYWIMLRSPWRWSSKLIQQGVWPAKSLSKVSWHM
jgi:hypothetical protein